MPKQYEDYTTDADGDEHHPAFGTVSLHRVSANPGAVLFQSDVRHPEYMRIAVHEATRKRDLHSDWVHPERMVCEFSLSMAQFASFVASTGQGSGVPCTIEWTGTGTQEPGDRPGLLPAPRFSLTHDEVRAAALQYVRKITGFNKPSQANQAAFLAAVEEVAAVSAKLLCELETAAPPKSRAEQAARAKARAAVRFAASESK